MGTFRVSAVGEVIKCDVCFCDLLRSEAHTASAPGLRIEGFDPVAGEWVNLSLEGDGWALCSDCWFLLEQHDTDTMVNRALLAFDPESDDFILRSLLSLQFSRLTIPQ